MILPPLTSIGIDFNQEKDSSLQFQENMLVQIIRNTGISPCYWSDRPIPQSFYVDKPHVVSLVWDGTGYLEPYILTKEQVKNGDMYPQVVLTFEQGINLGDMFNWIRILSHLLNMAPEYHVEDDFRDYALKQIKNNGKVMKEGK
jgi:hypothetical protein